MSNPLTVTILPRKSSLPSWIKWLCIVMLLAILINLTLPARSSSTEGGFTTVQLNKARNICVLLQLYEDEHAGHYPENLEELVRVNSEGGQAISKLLTIDLEDGKPPRQWYYHEGLDEKSSLNEWVLISPVLLNSSISDFERNWRRWKGGIQPPPPTAWRIVFHKDGSGEAMPESKFRMAVQYNKWVIPEMGDAH